MEMTSTRRSFIWGAAALSAWPAAAAVKPGGAKGAAKKGAAKGAQVRLLGQEVKTQPSHG